MKYFLYILFFVVCALPLSLPIMAQAQVTVTNSQARGGQRADAPRFTPSQMASRWGGTHQEQGKQADQETQATQTATNAQPTPPDGTTNAPVQGSTPVSPPHGENQAQSSLGNNETAPPAAEGIIGAPPHRGSNAVITITPSTALKSGSAYSQNAEETEEKSITSWSSDATKAIIHYQEPAEPKPSTGAPQLRPLTE